MALGDIRVMNPGAFGDIGAHLFNVAAGATTINAGEPVVKALGAATVTAAADGTPVVGTDYVVGIAMTTSTQTASAAGVVWVQPLVPGVIYGTAPKTAASWDTQAEYDALVGDRVVWDLTAGVYTVDATDSANNGLVVEAMSITENPSTVAYSIRNGASYLA